MEELDPATVLRNLRSRTPTRPMPLPPQHLPDAPPRPESSSAVSRVPALEIKISSLEASLTQKTASEQQLRDENRRLKDVIRQLKEEKHASEGEYQDKITSLQDELDRMRRLTAQLRGKLSTQALKADIPKTPPRKVTKAAKQPEKQELDLGPLVELYKRMPDFPRPILQIDFSPYISMED